MYINSEYWKGKYKILKKLFSHNVSRIILYYEFNNMKTKSSERLNNVNKFNVDKGFIFLHNEHFYGEKNRSILRKCFIYYMLREWRYDVPRIKNIISKEDKRNKRSDYEIIELEDHFIDKMEEIQFLDLIDIPEEYGWYDDDRILNEAEMRDYREMCIYMTDYYLKSIIN